MQGVREESRLAGMNDYITKPVRMRQALKEQDSELLYRAAHTLKPTSSSLGAIILSNLSEELEEIARSEQWHGAEEKVHKIEAEYERVKAALKEF